MKEYTAVVSVSFAGNNLEAENKEHYIQKLKDSFMDEFGLDIEDMKKYLKLRRLVMDAKFLKKENKGRIARSSKIFG